MHPQFTATNDTLVELLNNFELDISADTDSSSTPLVPIPRLPIELITTSDAGLEERLSKALNGSQDIDIIPNLLDAEGKVDIERLPIYKLPPGRKMTDEVRRHTMADAMENQKRAMFGLDQHYRGKEQAFYDLRQSFIHLGNHYDHNRSLIVVRDEEETSSIYMRVLEVRKAADETPLFLVLYAHDLKYRFPSKGPMWLAEIQRNFTQDMMPVIVATPMEQHLLLRLLDMNARRIPSTLRRSRISSERDFSLSFLLPVGPLSSDVRDTVTLLGPSSCAVCGEPSTSYCGGCRAVRYCSPEHAKANWKAHKSVCLNLKGATWINFPFQLPKPEAQKRYTAVINMKSMNQGPRKFAPNVQQESDQPPKNIHGSKPFVVKVQWPIHDPSVSMFMYDQARSFEINMESKDCPREEWMKLRVAAEKGAMPGYKLFIWARRKGDLELSFAIDRLPPQTVPW